MKMGNSPYATVSGLAGLNQPTAWRVILRCRARPGTRPEVHGPAAKITCLAVTSSVEVETRMSEEKLSTIVAGQRPTDLSRQEAVAYDFASALVSGGVLPELTYRAAIEQFGKHGAAELSYLVGLYCLVSVTLNTFDVPVPD
jgi:hypothetical protein